MLVALWGTVRKTGCLLIGQKGGSLHVPVWLVNLQGREQKQIWENGCYTGQARRRELNKKKKRHAAHYFDGKGIWNGTTGGAAKV